MTILGPFLLLACIVGSLAGEEPGQQSPQPPVPLVLSTQAVPTPEPGTTTPTEGLEDCCPFGSCPDKMQLRLARHEEVRARLLGSELDPEHRVLAASWGAADPLPPVPGELLEASRTRLGAWLDGRPHLLARALRVDLRPRAPDPWEEPETLSPARSRIQEDKRTAVYRPHMSSGPYWDALDWARWPVTPAWSRTLTVAAGDRVDIRFSRLRPALGYLAPDPVAWLLETTESGDPAGGRVVAWSDDHGSAVLPRLRWTATAPTHLRLLVAAYQPSAAGFAKLVVRVNGRTVWDDAGIFFGGIRIPQVEVAPGDVFYAVAGRAAGSIGGGDAAIFLLSEGFNEGAAWQGVNNSLGLVPELTVAGEAEDATILFSAFGRTHLDTPRLLHSRGASGGSLDLDGDGLDGFLEGILGTCDGPPDVAVGASCTSPMAALKGWDPRDTDMDGPSDLEELVGVRRCYPREPQPPTFDPGPCRDRDQDGRCDRICRAGDHVVEQPLGPALDADPRRYDVWVELDGREVTPEKGGTPVVCHPTGPALVQIRDLYDPPVIAGRRRPHEGFGIAVHWFNDSVQPVGVGAFRPKLPSQAERRGWFNMAFSAARKYSGVFRYMVGASGSGGQSDVKGRVGTVGVDATPAGGMRVAHELGHQLGLSHHWDRPNPDRTPFYLSLMNYGYMYRIPPLVDWDGTFASCGLGRPPCSDGFVCVEAGKAWRCVPDCGRRSNKAAPRPWGFSTGALTFTAEPRELDEIPEEGYPSWFLSWLYCYTDERHRISHSERLARFLSPMCNLGRCVQCEGDTCWIDWDRDGSFAGAEGFDIDYSATVDDVLLKDHDDFTRMIELGRHGLGRMSYRDTVLLADGLEPGVRTGLAPGGPAAPEPDGGLWADITNVCDEAGRWSFCKKRRGNHAGLFRGPASGDRGMCYDFCDPSDKPCRDRYRSAAGATLSLRVKAWSPTWDGEGITLAWLAGYRLEAQVTEDGREVRWSLLPPNGDSPLVEIRDRGAVGQWTRLVVWLNWKKKEVRLTARRGKIVRETEHRLKSVAPLDLSRLWVGASPGKVTLLTGLIDDVVLVSWPVRY